MSNETFGCSSLNADVNPSVSNTVVSVLSIKQRQRHVLAARQLGAAALSPAGSVVSVDAPTGETTATDDAKAEATDEANALSPLLIAASPFSPGHMSEGVNRFNSERTVTAGACKDLSVSERAPTRA